MDQQSDQTRDEVYERIPWETLEKRSGDRQWMVYAVAGAVTLGALAYSFTRNQPAPEPTAPPVAATTEPAGRVPVSPVPPPSQPAPTVASPLVISEADLYAVEPERILDQAVAHAEWFAVEYIAIDGDDTPRSALRSLLPVGLPLPEAPAGTQVFVDWARAIGSTQTGDFSFEIEVLVRSLVSRDDSGFARQPPLVLSIAVELADDGSPRVVSAPVLEHYPDSEPPAHDLVEVPADVLAGADVAGDVIGGRPTGSGEWEVVKLVVGEDGVRRPVTVRVPG